MNLCQFVCADIGTRLAESTIIQKHMISTLPGVRLKNAVCCTLIKISLIKQQEVQIDPSVIRINVFFSQCTTAAMECMRQYTSELLDFIADMHTLTKLKVSLTARWISHHEPVFILFYFFFTFKCRAIWKRAVSHSTRTRLGETWKWAWHKLQPWRSAKAITVITKLWSVIFPGCTIHPPPCSKGKHEWAV